MPVTSERYLPEGLPEPEITNLDREYWSAAHDGRLVMQTCADCAQDCWPPEEICAGCHSTNRAWRPLSGLGKIHSWTRAWHPVHPALREAGPYVVVVVALDGSPMLMIGNLLGDPEQPVAIGDPVEAVFESRPGDYALIQWQKR